MKNLLLRVLPGIILMAICFSVMMPVEAARITKTLDKDTRIMPSGSVALKEDRVPVFKAGTDLILNEAGQVLEGTLASAVLLTCVSMESQYTERFILFLANSKIVFNNKGEVVKGTISDGPYYQDGVYLILGRNSYLALLATKEISFHQNGMLATGTLFDDMYLHPVGWSQLLDENMKDKINCPGYVLFKRFGPIELNDKGEVKKGTLTKDTKLFSKKSDSLLSPGGGLKVYEAGTTVELDDEGFVIKATKK